MKRDRQLIIDILKAVEQDEGGDLLEYNLVKQFPDHDAETTRYHIRLLRQAGYIQGTGIELTWDGHEYLDRQRHVMWENEFNTKRLGKPIDWFGWYDTTEDTSNEDE